VEGGRRDVRDQKKGKTPRMFILSLGSGREKNHFPTAAGIYVVDQGGVGWTI